MSQYQGFSVSCNCAAVYTAGTTAVFRLKCNGCTPLEHSLKVCATGTVHVEKRWVKSNLGDKLMQDTFPSTTGAYGSNRSLVFMTDYVSPLEIKKDINVQEEFFIQFDIPFDVLPSFKGLSVFIQYNLEIKMDGKETILFPFVVEGEGLSSMSPYQCRKGTITYFTNIDISEESQFSRPYQPDPSLVFSLVKNTASVYDKDELICGRMGEEVGENAGGPRVPSTTLSSHSYKISDDEGLICTLHILRAGFGKFILPGDDINIRVDFLDSTHPCRGIRAKVTQKELRRDNSRIQEKIVSVMAKGTDSAVLLNISLPIPVDAPPTFDCPIVKIRYYLDLSFFLESDVTSEPFVWSIPLTIAPRRSVALLDEQESRAVNPLEMMDYWPKNADAVT